VCPAYLLNAARAEWDSALQLGEQHGYRNAQVTVIAPTGTIGLLMDCDTTGIEPDFALVKFKKLAGGGYFKIINQSVPAALAMLGYGDTQIADIVRYCKGAGTLVGSPRDLPRRPQAQGLHRRGAAEDRERAGRRVRDRLRVQPLRARRRVLPRRARVHRQAAQNPLFNMLEALGFTSEDIQRANDYVCGTMTVEGAPHLKAQHLPVFDCANRCGRYGKRFIARWPTCA
jgi:ribonucleoside-diphosphate reductase alpha chain